MNKGIIPSFRDTVFNDTTKDLAEDFFEIGIDAVMEEDLLSEIPIMKSIVALGKTGFHVQERNLMKQTLNFVKGFNSGKIDEEKLTKYREKIFVDAKYAEKELGRIIIILNQQIENIQSERLGRLYSSYVKSAITWEKFCEFAEANRRMFIEDYLLLEKLNRESPFDNSLGKQDKYKVGRLIGLGMVVEKDSPAADRSDITKLINGGYSSHTGDNRRTINGIIPKSYYELTSFGKGFLQHLRADKE